MNTHVKPVPPATQSLRLFGRKTFIALLAGSALLAAALGVRLYSNSTNNEDSTALTAASAQAEPAYRYSAPSRAGSSLASRFVFLVASEEEATRAWAIIDQGQDILYSLGEPMLAASVVVVPSRELSTEVLDAVTEGNRVLTSLGLPLDSVVDLRSP